MKSFKKSDVNKVSDLERAIKTLKHAAPSAWEEIGKHIRGKAIPVGIDTDVSQETIVRAYTKRSTYVEIGLELGFFDN